MSTSDVYSSTIETLVVGTTDGTTAGGPPTESVVRPDTGLLTLSNKDNPSWETLVLYFFSGRIDPLLYDYTTTTESKEEIFLFL